jgi:hypothetical protein
MRATERAVSETIDMLGELYRFREPDEVRAYLARNPDLLDLLVEGAGKIPTFLPGEEPIILEVVVDPEDESDAGGLVAIVRTTFNVKDVRTHMDRLLREWLISAGQQTFGRFGVGVEYR